jgi:hypothetical protein
MMAAVSFRKRLKSIERSDKGMSYQPGVKRLEMHRYQEKKIINEESLVKLIRLSVLPLCLLFWYGIYHCCRILIYLFF